jgi:hypothetical protein
VLKRKYSMKTYSDTEKKSNSVLGENMATIEFSYSELAQIRQLCQSRRLAIWDENFAKRLPKNEPLERIEKAYQLLIIEDTNPFSEVGRCNNILNKIQQFDDQIKKVLANFG